MKYLLTCYNCFTQKYEKNDCLTEFLKNYQRVIYDVICGHSPTAVNEVPEPSLLRLVIVVFDGFSQLSSPSLLQRDLLYITTYQQPLSGVLHRL